MLSPEIGKAAFRVAILIVLLAAALLVTLRPGTPEFAITVVTLAIGLIFGVLGFETLLVLSVACGVTVGTQPADSGFWMVKEYGNLSTSDVLVRFNGCRLLMALTGLTILLIVEWWLR